MSAGSFLRSKYELSALADKVVAIRVQPETLTMSVGGTANAEPPGVIDESYPSAKVSGSRRGIGIHPRMATFVITGTPPTGYKPDSPISLPCLTPEFAALVVPGATGEYTVNGSTVTIEFIGKATPELIK